MSIRAESRTGSPIHLWAPEFGQGGGIQAFSEELARALSEFDPVHLARQSSAETATGIRVPRSSWPTRSIRFASMLIQAAYQQRPSLIVSTHVNFGPVASLLKSMLRVPYLLVAHGKEIGDDLSSHRKRALRNADKIVAVSAHTRERLLKIGGIQSKTIEVIGNTVDDTRFSLGYRDDDFRHRYGLSPDKKVILTVGRLNAAEAYKGYDQIIRAMPRILQEIPNAHYLIAGKGDDTVRVKSLINEMGIGSHVTLAGFVPDHELAAHYQMAEVFAMPSTGEGFGIVYLESMACGVPVLAGNLDGSVDALANGELGVLVDPRSVEQISSGLIRLLKKQGPEFWYRPEALRQAMLSRFSREAFSKRWIGLVTAMTSPTKRDISISKIN